MAYLEWATKGPVIAICGQSNAQGFSTGAASSLPDTDLEGDATVKVKPAGVSFYEDGSAVAAWTNPFGLEVGIASVLQNCTILKRGENGTSISSWSTGAGHMITAIADWNTVGVMPDVLVWFQGEADSQTSEAVANAYYDDLYTLLGRVKNVAGASVGFVAVRIPVIDAGYAYADIVRAKTKLYCSDDNRTGKCNAYLDPTSETWHSGILQGDNIHLTGIGMYHYGKFVGEFLKLEGYG